MAEFPKFHVEEGEYRPLAILNFPQELQDNVDTQK